MRSYLLTKVDPIAMTLVSEGEIQMSDKFFDLMYSQTEGTEHNSFHRVMYDYHRMNELVRNAVTPRDKDGNIKFNYIDIKRKDKGMVSFMPGGREQKITADDKWALDGRQTMKFGRFIKAFFPPQLLEKHDLTDAILEKYGSVVKGQMNMDDYEVRILDGEDIRWAYHEDNYTQANIPGGHASSAIWSSCMRYDKCQPWLDVYVQEENIKLVALIHIPTGKLAARALLWHDLGFRDWNEYGKDFPDTIRLMDRVYAYREWMIEFMLDWASENGYWKKYRQSAEHKVDFVKPNSERIAGFLEFKLSRSDYEYFPYMDTLTFAPEPIDALWNNSSASHRYDYELTDHTDGNVSATGGESNNHSCDDCDEDGFAESDLTTVNGDRHICSECLEDSYNYSDYHDAHFHQDDVCYVESVEDYRLNREVVECNISGNYILIDDSVEAFLKSNNWGYIHCEYAVRLTNGDYYQIGHDDVREIDGEYYHVDDCFYCDYSGRDYPESARPVYIDCTYETIASENLEDYLADNPNIIFDAESGQYREVVTEQSTETTNESISQTDDL